MFIVTKTLEVSGAHFLDLPYESPCKHLHGHNWKISVTCASRELNEQGMVIDFKKIKHLVDNKLDHKFLNNEFNFNPTAENIARWLCDTIPHCCKVIVQESDGNVATYVAEGFYKGECSI